MAWRGYFVKWTKTKHINSTSKVSRGDRWLLSDHTVAWLYICNIVTNACKLWHWLLRRLLSIFWLSLAPTRHSITFHEIIWSVASLVCSYLNNFIADWAVVAYYKYAVILSFTLIDSHSNHVNIRLHGSLELWKGICVFDLHATKYGGMVNQSSRGVNLCNK